MMNSIDNRITCETIEDMAHIDAVDPKYKLVKGIIKYEVTCNGFELDISRQIIYRRTEIMRRLFFLKKLGFPLGCILDAFNPFVSVTRDVYTPSGRMTGYTYNGVRFMTKTIKPTKNGWQVEFIYRG